MARTAPRLLALVAGVVVGLTGGCATPNGQPVRQITQTTAGGADLALKRGTTYGAGDIGDAHVDVMAHQFPDNMSDPAAREAFVVNGAPCGEHFVPGGRDRRSTLAWLESTYEKSTPQGSENKPLGGYVCVGDGSENANAILFAANRATYAAGPDLDVFADNEGPANRRAMLAHPVVVTGDELGPIEGTRVITETLGTDDSGLAPFAGSNASADEKMTGVIGSDCAALGRRADGTWVGVGADPGGYWARDLANSVGIAEGSVVMGSEQGSLRPSAQRRGACAVPAGEGLQPPSLTPTR